MTKKPAKKSKIKGFFSEEQLRKMNGNLSPETKERLERERTVEAEAKRQERAKRAARKKGNKKRKGLFDSL